MMFDISMIFIAPEERHTSIASGVKEREKIVAKSTFIADLVQCKRKYINGFMPLCSASDACQCRWFSSPYAVVDAKSTYSIKTMLENIRANEKHIEFPSAIEIGEMK